MRNRLRAINNEMYQMVHALVASWPAVILAALFILAAMILDAGGRP